MDGRCPMRATRWHVGTVARRVACMSCLLAVVPTCRLVGQDTNRISEAQSVLSQLVESYGVSGMEAPVRATVQRLLPSWVKTETDTAGNLWVRVGQGDGPVVIVAHLDEIGFRIDTINADGTLGLRNRGGFTLSLFKAKPALIHTGGGAIPGIFLPRDSGLTRRTPPPLRVSVGATSRAAARQLGTTTRRVHAIDTFVSADSPLELQNFAVAKIGAGAVARALDNSSITPPAYVDSLAELARARGVALQIGTTNGGNDGSTFVPYGVVDVPLGWPLRYSHSPAELVDLRDLLSLAELVRAVAEDW